MKYLLILTLTILIGCGDKEANIINGLQNLQRETQMNLQSCKSQLDTYRERLSAKSEPEATPEPVCEDTDYDTLYVNGKKLDTCKSSEVVAKECGISAIDCDSGFAYACLRDVQYKTSNRKKCE